MARAGRECLSRPRGALGLQQADSKCLGILATIAAWCHGCGWCPWTVGWEGQLCYHGHVSHVTTILAYTVWDCWAVAVGSALRGHEARWVPSLALGTWGQQQQMMVRIHLSLSGRREHLCSSDVPHCSIGSINISSLIAVAVKKKNHGYFFLHICSFCFYLFPQPFLSPSLLTVSRKFLLTFTSSHAKLVSPSHYLSESRHSLKQLNPIAIWFIDSPLFCQYLSWGFQGSHSYLPSKTNICCDVLKGSNPGSALWRRDPGSSVTFCNAGWACSPQYAWEGQGSHPWLGRVETFLDVVQYPQPHPGGVPGGWCLLPGCAPDRPWVLWRVCCRHVLHCQQAGMRSEVLIRLIMK